MLDELLCLGLIVHRNPTLNLLLELDSTTEVGTTVTISIPRERVIEF